MEYAIAGLGVLNAVLIVGGFYFLEQRIRDALDDLDSHLAQAIKGLLEAVPFEGFEPPNPIQQALAQWIASQAQARSQIVEATVTERDGAGRFAPRND